jgi:cytochrome c oxidase assembly protein subunit 15
LILLVYSWFQWLITRREFRGSGWSPPDASIVAILVTVQVALGVASWCVRYGVPQWMSGGEVRYLIVSGGMLQSQIVTAHVAVGSLILAFSTLWAVRVSCPAWTRRLPRAENRLESHPAGLKVAG